MNTGNFSVNPTMMTNMLGGANPFENNGLTNFSSQGQLGEGNVFNSQFSGLWQESVVNGGNRLPVNLAAIDKLDPELIQRLSELLEMSQEELLALPASSLEPLLQHISIALKENISGSDSNRSLALHQSELNEADSLNFILNPEVRHSLQALTHTDNRQQSEIFLFNQSQNNQLANKFDIQSFKQLLESADISDKQLFKDMGLEFKALLTNSDKVGQSFLSLRDLPTGNISEKITSADRTNPLQTGLFSLTNSQTMNRSDHLVFSIPKIQVPIQQSQWGQVVGERLMFMVNDKIQVANIMINPPELGPIEVRLNMNNDHASVHFVSNHASVRDAIEEAFPRLREMFSQNGMSLADTNVSQHSAQQNAKQEQTFTENNLPGEQQNDIQETRTLSIGLIDQFV